MHRGFIVFTALTLVALVLAPLTVSGAAGGIEFNIVDVWVPSSLYGQLGVYALPFNVSDPSLLSFSTMYIIDEGGRPYYSYLFSNSPPLAVWVDGGISSKTFSIFYGGSNPYPEYVATPGGSVPLFAAYDDYDYDSGLWSYTGGHSISQSQLSLTGRMTLNTSYTPGVYALWLVRFGGYGTLIQLYSPKGYAGWVYLHLDSSNFGDWGSIRDGTDIYFTDMFGNPLNYTIAYLDKTKQEADIFFYITMNPGETKMVYMFYGRDNPYPEYNTPITWPITAVDITPRTKPTTYPQSTHKITGYTPTNIKPVTLTLTNIDLTGGDVIAPHLYDWYFDGVDDYVIYDGYNYPQDNFTDIFTVIIRFKDVEYTTWRKLVTFAFGASPGLGQFGEGGGNDYYAQVSNGSISIQSIGYDANMGNPLNWPSAGLIESPDGFYTIGWSYNVTYGKITGYRYVNDLIVEGIAAGPAYGDLVAGFTQVWIAKAGYWKGYISYVILKKAWKSWSINPLDDTVLVLLDPTFYNGTHYLDLVNNVVGAPYGGVEHVPAEQTWLWLVKELESDGFVHLRFFPVGSVVRFVDVYSGEVVATVYVGGLANGAGLVPDLWVPLPSGTYNVSVETFVGVGSDSVWTGLGLYTGSLWTTGLSRDQAIRTVNGGTIYIEYVGTDYVVAWYQPSPFIGRSVDYTTSETGYSPFPYWNEYTSSTGLKILYGAGKPIRLTANVTVSNNKVTVVPHLFDWVFDGTGYISVVLPTKYGYRTTITITERSGTTLTDYQVKIELDSTWDGWSYVSSDGSDIYFLDASGNPLYYWIEEWDTVNKHGVIWVKVPSIPAGGTTTIYMYFGGTNPYQSYNDPTKVFIFFDDMEVWSGWVQYGTGEVVQDSTRYYDGQYSAHKITSNDPNGAYKAIGTTIGRNITLEFWVNRNSAYTGGAYDRIGIIDDSGNGYGWVFGHDTDFIAVETRSLYNGNLLATSSATDYMDTWVFAQLIILDNGTLIARRYVNGVLDGEVNATNTNHAFFTNVYIFGGYDYWVDQMRIRKYVAPEPSATVGSTEVLTSPLSVYEEFTFEAMVSVRVFGSSATIFKFDDQPYGYSFFKGSDDKVYVGMGDGSTWYTYSSSSAIQDSGSHYIAAAYSKSLSTINFYYDGALDTSTTATPITIAYAYTSGFTIGNGLEGTIGFIRVFNRTLTDTEILDAYTHHTINVDKLLLFLDPTLYNGTHYIDPLNTLSAIPTNTKRIESKTKWLWILVNNTDTSNTIEFKWFPENTIIVIKNATTGEVITSFGVPPGEQGTKTTLEPGDYTIETIIYQPGTYKTITTTMTIQANDAIAPHLYDLYFDGVDDYVRFDGVIVFSTVYASFEVRVLLVRLGVAQQFVSFAPPGSGNADNIYVIGTNYIYFNMWMTGYWRGISDGQANANTWYNITGELYNDTIKLYVDGVLQASSDTDLLPDYVGEQLILDIGHHVSNINFFNGYISYFKVTDNGKTYHLIDPTFFNGTHYFDLISGIVGTPYGGVQRVVSDSWWLWRVVGVAGDGYVHFRYFPRGTIIRLYTTSGVLKYVFYIDGTVNGAGLVEDYRVSVASGTYVVEAVIPVWGSGDEVSVSFASVSYGGSRDGYSLELSVGSSVPVVEDGFMNTSVLVAPSINGVSGISWSWLKPVYVWGGVPVYDLSGSTGLGTVFEARLFAGSNWSIAVLNMSNSVYKVGWTGDLSPVAIVYGYNNRTYLYYGLDDVVVDTGLMYNASSWVYVYIELRPDGSIVVGVGPGDYVGGGIYDTLYTYTYVPSNWAPMYVAFGVGVFIKHSGSYTLYIDWLRIRPSMAGRITVTSTSKELWYSEEKVLTLNGVPGNWSTFMDLSNAKAFEVTLYGANGTYRIVYGSILDAFGSTYSYVVGEPTGSLVLYNGSSLLVSKTLSPTLSGRLVISYNSSHLEIGLLSGNTYTPVIVYGLNESFYNIAKLLVAKDADTVVDPMYVAETTDGFNMVESITQTIAPTSPGGTNVYRLGFTYNTTINNATYTAEWGILINGTIVQLYVDENGTTTLLDLGTAKTPMIVGIGYDFENTTKRLSVFGMIVWSESLGDKLVTKYLSRYIDITMNASIEWAIPFAEALNDPLLIDRFGLTLGWLMNQIIRGNIIVQISGYYPVGGLIKYVSITSPIKIRIVNGNIVVEPASTTEGTIVLEGFQGWTLNLAIYGADVSDVQIPSDPYIIDFPTGFTAVIVADISARKISIVSATPPSMIGVGQVPTGQHIVAPIISAPKFTHVYDPEEIVNTIILGATLVASAIVATRLTGNIGDGLVIAGFVATILFLLLGDYMNMSIATMIMIVGFAIRKALSS